MRSGCPRPGTAKRHRASSPAKPYSKVRSSSHRHGKLVAEKLSADLAQRAPADTAGRPAARLRRMSTPPASTALMRHHYREPPVIADATAKAENRTTNPGHPVALLCPCRSQRGYAIAPRRIIAAGSEDVGSHNLLLDCTDDTGGARSTCVAMFPASPRLCVHEEAAAGLRP